MFIHLLFLRPIRFLGKPQADGFVTFLCHLRRRSPTAASCPQEHTYSAARLHA